MWVALRAMRSFLVRRIRPQYRLNKFVVTMGSISVFRSALRTCARSLQRLAAPLAFVRPQSFRCSAQSSLDTVTELLHTIFIHLKRCGSSQCQRVSAV